MNRFSLTCSAAIALFASTVSAENLRVYHVQEGGGVTVIEGNITAVEGAIVLGVNPPPAGTTGIVFQEGEEPAWTNESDREVHKQYGGTGDPSNEILFSEEDGLQSAETADDEMTFDESEGLDPSADDETDGDEMTFEDPANPTTPAPTDPMDPTPTTEPGDDPAPGPGAAAPSAQSPASTRITLEGGTWFGDVVSTDVTGCPAPAKSAVESAAASLNGSILQGQIDADFHPTRISPQFTWTENGSNSWSGLLDQRSPQGVGATVQWWVYIRAPDLIENRQVTSFYLPGATCRSDLKFYYHKP
jgi:hypothetical protein